VGSSRKSARIQPTKNYAKIDAGFSRHRFQSAKLVWHRTNLRGVTIALQSIRAVRLRSREPNSLNTDLEVFMYLPISLGGIVLVLVVLYLLGVI
jgi:hypothetical protein